LSASQLIDGYWDRRDEAMTPTEYGAAREYEKPQDRIAREAKALERRWILESRWKGIRRDYRAADVMRLRGSFRVEHTIARLGAERLWDQLNSEEGEPVCTFGALTGAQAV
jgi:isocitrate lyase